MYIIAQYGGRGCGALFRMLGCELGAGQPEGIDLGGFASCPVGVVGVDPGGADHLEADLLKGNQGADQAGEVAADGELGDVVCFQGSGDGLDVLIPNDLIEVDEVVAAAAAVAVGPEGGGLMPSARMSWIWLAMAFSKAVIFFMVCTSGCFVVHIFALNAQNSKLYLSYKLHKDTAPEVCIL